MVDCIPYHLNHKPMQELLADPEIKIVAMTVTEGGYFWDNGKYNAEDPRIKHNIQNLASPKTIFGLMIQALKN